MMRVLHIGKFYPPYKGGMETHLQELCRAVSDRASLDVIVANSSVRTELDADGLIRIQRVGTLVNISSAPICPQMARVIRATPADIVHLHSPNPTAVISYFASGHRGRLVVTHHSDIVRQRLLKFAYEPWLRRLMTRADGIICFSPNYIDSSDVLSRHRNKCHVIPHGIDPSQFANVNPQEVTEIRQRYGDRIVLAVGRLVYYKGFDYLIRAVARTTATLLIIGTGPLEMHLRQIARDCGITDRVHILGEVQDVVRYYQAARIFALPSIARSEAFGIVQLEAMACGTPVINTQLDSGVPFVSAHDISGLTVAPADSLALERAISRLLGDDALYGRLSAGARERVRRHFHVDEMARRTYGLYKEILSKNSQVAQKEQAAAAYA